jgi:hypothetical protein
MATTIKHKRSSVSGNIPAAGVIEVGEIAINFADQKIYTKTGAGTVIELSPTASGTYALLTGATFTGEVIAPEFTGDITGAILFKGQAGESLTKGDPVYISGISGNTTIVSKADADDASKMPCFGIVDDNTSLNAACSIVTFGTLQGLNTSGFTEGDELFISSTGTLTDISPTGESAQIQKIAKVTRSHASAGSIKIMGAGRSNATPNLNTGNIFLGNGSNQSVATSLSTAVSTISVPLSGGTMTGQLVLNSTDSLKVSAGTTAERDTSPTAGSFRYNSTTGEFEGYTTEWSGFGGNATLTLLSFTGDGSAVDFTLSSNPQENNTLVYIDGVYQNKTSYSISNSVLTFSGAPDNGAAIEVTVPGIAPIEEYTLFKVNQFTGDNSTTAFTLSGTVLENNTNVYWDGVYQSKSNYSVSGTTLTFLTAPPTGVSVEVMAGETTTVTMTPDDNTVTTAKIADGAITSAKLGAGVGGAFNDFAIKTTAYTAVTRDQLIVNSSSAVTITLPASPSAGNVVFIKNVGTGATTVGRNGSNINSTADDGELATDASATLVYVDSTIGWKEI